jgi:hypothetical protein
MITKEFAKKLQRDYVPNGQPTDYVDAIRDTKDYEIYQCACSTGYDPQSGPIYCGDIADYLGTYVDKTCYVSVCKRHKHVLDRLLAKGKQK